MCKRKKKMMGVFCVMFFAFGTLESVFCSHFIVDSISNRNGESANICNACPVQNLNLPYPLFFVLCEEKLRTLTLIVTFVRVYAYTELAVAICCLIN